MNKFKDKCDICNKFDYLISYKNICICKNCVYQIDKLTISVRVKRKIQLSLFNESERKRG